EIAISILLGVFGASCFYSSLDGYFVFDDSEAIVNNADILLETPVINIFKNDFWGTRLTHNASHKSYRPLTVLSFRMATALTLPIFVRLFNTHHYWKTPLLSSLLFAAHPVHSEAVAGIVGRADLLCAVFCFSSLLMYCRASDSNSVLETLSYTVFSTILAALAMLAKEQGITILVMIYIILTKTQK
ncbi:hypothetical protein AAG570_000742, partial [Ranatra chinensis]